MKTAYERLNALADYRDVTIPVSLPMLCNLLDLAAKHGAAVNSYINTFASYLEKHPGGLHGDAGKEEVE